MLVAEDEGQEPVEIPSEEDGTGVYFYSSGTC